MQRGIITAEVQHRRQTRFTITSRLTQPTKVYLRHRLESGWTLVEAPSKHMKVGDSQLFEVELGAGETKYVTIAEATPVERTLELGSTEALDMMKVFIDEPEASPELKKQITALLDDPPRRGRPRRQDRDAARSARRVPRARRRAARAARHAQAGQDRAAS